MNIKVLVFLYIQVLVKSVSLDEANLVKLVFYSNQNYVKLDTKYPVFFFSFSFSFLTFLGNLLRIKNNAV